MAVRYHELTRKQLTIRLQKKDILPSIRRRIIDRAEDTCACLQRERRMGNNLNRAWELYIAPLKLEMNRAGTRRAQAKELQHAERLAFFTAYYALLSKVLNKLRLRQRTGGKYPAHYGKATWVDWVPEEIREAFMKEHASLYTNFKARTPSPIFLFTDPEEKRSALKEEIIASWTPVLREAESQVDKLMAGGKPQLARLPRRVKLLLEKATTRLRYLPANKQIKRDFMHYLTWDEKEDYLLYEVTQGRDIPEKYEKRLLQD